MKNAARDAREISFGDRCVKTYFPNSHKISIKFLPGQPSHMALPCLAYLASHRPPPHCLHLATTARRSAAAVVAAVGKASEACEARNAGEGCEAIWQATHAAGMCVVCELHLLAWRQVTMSVLLAWRAKRARGERSERERRAKRKQAREASEASSSPMRTLASRSFVHGHGRSRRQATAVRYCRSYTLVELTVVDIVRCE